MSKRHNPNNFTDPATRSAAVYKLMVKYLPEFAAKYPHNPMYYYGRNHKKENGLELLLKLSKKKQKQAALIILYKNQEFNQILHKTYEKQPARQS